MLKRNKDLNLYKFNNSQIKFFSKYSLKKKPNKNDYNSYNYDDKERLNKNNVPPLIKSFNINNNKSIYNRYISQRNYNNNTFNLSNGLSNSINNTIYNNNFKINPLKNKNIVHLSERNNTLDNKLIINAQKLIHLKSDNNNNSLKFLNDENKINNVNKNNNKNFKYNFFNSIKLNQQNKNINNNKNNIQKLFIHLKQRNLRDILYNKEKHLNYKYNDFNNFKEFQKNTLKFKKIHNNINNINISNISNLNQNNNKTFDNKLFLNNNFNNNNIKMNFDIKLINELISENNNININNNRNNSFSKSSYIKINKTSSKKSEEGELGIDEVKDLIIYYDFKKLSKKNNENYLFNKNDYEQFINNKKEKYLNYFFN